jgi:hypothetical protein
MSVTREWKGAGLGAAVVALYMALVLASGRVDPGMFGRMLAFYVKTSFLIWLFMLGCTLLALMVIRGRKSGHQPFLKEFVVSAARGRWERDRYVSLLWPPLLFAGLLASFNSFKQMILPLAGYSWDPMLAAADKALFLGHDPWRVTHAIFSSPGATVFIDGYYHTWFLPMSLGVAVCAFMPASTYRLRTQYLLSYISVWVVIGSVFAFLMPSAGPCFYEPLVGKSASFHDLVQSLHAAQAATGADLISLNNQQMLLNLVHADKLIVGGGISAMPSVHNGLAFLFALGAFRLNRFAGYVAAAYAVMIWIGSIHLGWHYALDGMVAAVMTFVLWTICGRIAAAFDSDEVLLQPAPAIA